MSSGPPGIMGLPQQQEAHLADPWNLPKGAEQMHAFMSTPGPGSGSRRLMSPSPQHLTSPHAMQHHRQAHLPHPYQQPGLVALSQGQGQNGGSSSPGPPGMVSSENDKVYLLVAELCHPDTREAALLELSKKREQFDDLALVLWHAFGRSPTRLAQAGPFPGCFLDKESRSPHPGFSFCLRLCSASQTGVMSALIQEILSVYPLLSPPALTAHASNRVCNALALLQCVASHNETRSLFLQAHIPLFLYPFLNTTSKTRPFEYLRLTSLGVIGALVKQNDNSDVISFLLSTEIIPLCLRIMENGSELSKTVAIFIVQKILLDEMGLSYICQTYERFYAVGTVLSNMVNQLVETQAVRLLKHVVRCYLRLSDNMRCARGLRKLASVQLANPFTPAEPEKRCDSVCQILSETPPSAPCLKAISSPSVALPPCSSTCPIGELLAAPCTGLSRLRKCRQRGLSGPRLGLSSQPNASSTISFLLSSSPPPSSSSLPQCLPSHS